MTVARISSALLGLALVLTLAPCADASDLQEIRAAIAGEKDPFRRRVLIPRLVAVGGDDAAELLSRIVRKDVDLDVRIEAALGLGKVEAETALELLVTRTMDGGPRQLRAALDRALVMRRDSAAMIRETLVDDRTTATQRLLLIHALGAYRSPETFDALLALTQSKDVDVRGTALVALVRRRDHKDRALAHMVRLLATARAPEAILQMTDAFEPVVHPTMKPALERCATSLEPEVREAAEHMLRCLERKAKKAAPPPEPEVEPEDPDDPDARYAKPADRRDDVEDPPTPDPDPVPKTRMDIVYVLDATGSAHTNLPGLFDRIRTEMELLLRAGVSLRAGVVVYRGGHSRLDRERAIEVFPLSYDPIRVRAFLAAIKPRGVDNRGAAVAPALREALDRMTWRWNARRVVQLYADSKVDDPKDAARTVSQHFQADRTRTRVGYVLRTRTKVPETYTDLARRGGTGVVERIE